MAVCRHLWHRLWQTKKKPVRRVTNPAEDSSLRAEAESLEEILKNQAHPKNLVAVKKSGTPVVETASLTAKTLFLASAHDEFEMLDFNQDWVHVRISGLSRGWIWRNSLEMPDSVPDGDAPASAAPGSVAADLFHVTREESAPFPGDWAPLRGKSVRIVSVEKIDDKQNAGPQLRLEFAKSVLDKDYAELAQKPQELAGVVVIFDAVDGGMLAATYRRFSNGRRANCPTRLCGINAFSIRRKLSMGSGFRLASSGCGRILRFDQGSPCRPIRNFDSTFESHRSTHTILEYFWAALWALPSLRWIRRAVFECEATGYDNHTTESPMSAMTQPLILFRKQAPSLCATMPN